MKLSYIDIIKNIINKLNLNRNFNAKFENKDVIIMKTPNITTKNKNLYNKIINIYPINTYIISKDNALLTFNLEKISFDDKILSILTIHIYNLNSDNLNDFIINSLLIYFPNKNIDIEFFNNNLLLINMDKNIRLNNTLSNKYRRK